MTVHGRDNGNDVGTFEEFFSCRYTIIPPELPPINPRVIYDIGANIGMASLYYSGRYPKAQYFGFEPVPANVEVCHLNYGNFRIHTIRPIPNTAIDLLIHPIPRMLWTSKPIDPAFLWYNVVTRGDPLMAGNVSHGGAGYRYFRYGLWGVLEGGLLMGWIMALSERALRRSEGRPMAMIMSLGVAVWMFRCYRGFAASTISPLIIAGIVVWLLIGIERRLTSAR